MIPFIWTSQNGNHILMNNCLFLWSSIFHICFITQHFNLNFLHEYDGPLERTKNTPELNIWKTDFVFVPHGHIGKSHQKPLKVNIFKSANHFCIKYRVKLLMPQSLFFQKTVRYLDTIIKLFIAFEYGFKITVCWLFHSWFCLIILGAKAISLNLFPVF